MSADHIYNGVKWTPLPERDRTQCDDGLPWATHEGVLRIADYPPIRCYQLSDGTRIIDADDMAAFLGLEG